MKVLILLVLMIVFLIIVDGGCWYNIESFWYEFLFCKVFNLLFLRLKFLLVLLFVKFFVVVGCLFRFVIFIWRFFFLYGLVVF